MEKKYGIGIAVLLIVGLVAVGALAMGFKGGLGNKGGFGNNDAVQAAISSGDYNAYLQAIAANNSTGNHTRQRMTLTQDQFNKIAQQYQLEAPMRDARQKIDQAIKDDNYDAWASGMNAMLDFQKTQITQDNFNKIVQMEKDFQSRNKTGPRGPGMVGKFSDLGDDFPMKGNLGRGMGHLKN
jgi:hypothetical protein